MLVARTTDGRTTYWSIMIALCLLLANEAVLWIAVDIGIRQVHDASNSAAEKIRVRVTGGYVQPTHFLPSTNVLTSHPVFVPSRLFL
jgi:hypothetical protein